MNLTDLEISELIVHDVPQHLVSATGLSPTCSDVPSPLDDDLRGYFKGRLIQTLERNASAVEYDPTTSSKAPEELVGMLAKPSDFVSRSVALAWHLLNAQKGGSPGGLLILGLARWQGARGAVVLKLEREEALSLNRRQMPGGLTFDMAHLRNLMLGNRTRVFKAALFGMARQLSDLHGFVSDTQGGYGREAEVAHFFLSTFLGCRLVEEPSVTTRRFLDVLEEVVNERVEDPAMRARYRIAAIAALQDKARKLSPRAFAATHLEGEAEQAFYEVAKERGLHMGAFEKDLGLVRTRVARMAFQFENGIQVTGTADAIDKSVRVKRVDDGMDEMTIRDALKRVK